jgi:hypothetical protein
VRDEFDWSISHNLMTPSVPIESTVLSEKDKQQQLLRERSREVRDVFDLNALQNSVNTTASISFPVLSENERIISVTAKIQSVQFIVSQFLYRTFVAHLVLYIR